MVYFQLASFPRIRSTTKQQQQFIPYSSERLARKNTKDEMSSEHSQCKQSRTHTN